MLLFIIIIQQMLLGLCNSNLKYSVTNIMFRKFQEHIDQLCALVFLGTLDVYKCLFFSFLPPILILKSFLTECMQKVVIVHPEFCLCRALIVRVM